MKKKTMPSGPSSDSDSPEVTGSPIGKCGNGLEHETRDIAGGLSSGSDAPEDTGSPIGKCGDGLDYENRDIMDEVNVEVSVTTDDIVRTGGFGAKDDIGSFLPVAVDSTDFEVLLRDAREFEEPPKEISRPGLGCRESAAMAVNMTPFKEGNATQDSGYENRDMMSEVNMEAAITSDDIIRAGGLGATDDIGSFFPAAVDSTDFEASLRDARSFEEPQGTIVRPGLGWTEAMESKNH